MSGIWLKQELEAAKNFAEARFGWWSQVDIISALERERKIERTEMLASEAIEAFCRVELAEEKKLERFFAQLSIETRSPSAFYFSFSFFASRCLCALSNAVCQDTNV